MRRLPPPPLRSSTWLVCLLACLLSACGWWVGPRVDGPNALVRAPDADPGPAPEASPISLTASDGTGLVLATLQGKVVIEDPVAFTELTLEFDNPHGDRIEGRFEIVLPPDARVTRFATQTHGRWREAEVVEKQYARQVYEAQVLDQRDPALLERAAGNRFSARVFPIEPGERKRLVVSYTETMPDPRAPYRLPLRGLPWIERLELRAVITDPGTGRSQVVQRRLASQAPDADLSIARDAIASGGVRRGEHAIARLVPIPRPPTMVADDVSVGRLTVLLDTSASRALEHDAQVDALAGVLGALGRRVGTAHLEILAFDQVVVPLYSGTLVGITPATIAAMHARRPLGASDLGAALEALREGEHQRVLLVTDGLPSAGTESTAELRRILGTLSARGVERLDVLTTEGVRDQARLRALVTGGLPQGGVVLGPGTSPERAVDRLLQPTIDGLRLEVHGARWWSPTRIDGIQPGDAVLVYAELPADRPRQDDASLRVHTWGPVHEEQTLPLHAFASPLIDDAWHGAQIEGLVERIASLQDVLQSERLRRHAVSLSVRYRILNDLTAMLVLDTDEDYARFGIDRRTLGDIMMAGPSGVVLERRAVPEPEVEPEPEVPAEAGAEPEPDDAAAEVDEAAEDADEAEPVRTGTGAISGSVTHANTRERIPYALVVLQCSCLSGTRETQTNHDGLYRFGDLPKGAYTIQVLSGQADVSKVVDLPAGGKFRANFTIDPEAEFMRVIRVESKASYRRGGRRERRARRQLATETPDAAAMPPTDVTRGANQGPVPARSPPMRDLPPATASVAKPAPSPTESTGKVEPSFLPEPEPEPAYELDVVDEPSFGTVGEPIVQEFVETSATGRMISMEEAKQIPVGNSTSRDFTQVVESSPTASHDAAGISLAGTTGAGAESKYTYEGMDLRMGGGIELPPEPPHVGLRGIRVDGDGLGRRRVREIVRRDMDALKACYDLSLTNGTYRRHGAMELKLQLDRNGRVASYQRTERPARRDVSEDDVIDCVEEAMRRWRFPVHRARPPQVRMVLRFDHGDGPTDDAWLAFSETSGTLDEPREVDFTTRDPVTTFMEIDAYAPQEGLAHAQRWREAAPADVLALVGLGYAAVAAGDPVQAERAFGSIVDLYPERADMRRAAAFWLGVADSDAARVLAIDSGRKALAQRPDQPSSHRNLAFALLRHGEPEEAFDVLAHALTLRFAPGRFGDVHAILRQDLALVAAAWKHEHPIEAATIEGRLNALGIAMPTSPSLGSCSRGRPTPAMPICTCSTPTGPTPARADPCCPPAAG